MLFLNEILKYEKVPGKVIFDGDGNVPLPPHWHDNIELCYFIRGGFVANIDGRAFPVQPGELLIINSGVIHYTGDHTVGENRGVSVVADMDFLKKMCPNLDELEFSLAMAPSRIDEFVGLFHQLYDASLLYKRVRTSDSDNSPAASRELLQISGLVCLIYYMLTKYFSRPAVRRADCHSVFSRQNLQQALQYINTHYTENLTLQDAADFCGVSREHFSRVFKAHMGVTFKEYLYNIRLSHAYKLLLHTHKSMLDIAMESGFPDLRAFNRQFKQLYDTTPKACRKLLGVSPIDQEQQI